MASEKQSDRGADRYEAILPGVLYVLDDDPHAAELVREFSTRYQCDIQHPTNSTELLQAARSWRPTAIVLGGHPAGHSLAEILTELLVATFGAEPLPVVLRTEDEEVLNSFEVLTYPLLTPLGRDAGAEGLLAALERWVKIERTGVQPKRDAATKKLIGLPQAREVQRKLLPDGVPQVHGLDIGVYYVPCEEVGGDYYDFLPQAEGQLDVVCADASGKGVGAAMVMVMFRSILRLAAQRGDSPREIMRVTNQFVSKDMLRGMFVSTFFLRIDPQARRVTMVNAGGMPLLYRAKDKPMQVTRPAVGGVAVGLASDERFLQATREVELALRPGDALCLYTDGIVEATAPGGEEFGAERLVQALVAAGDVSAQETVWRVVAAVEAFCANAPQHDDATLVVLKIPMS